MPRFLLALATAAVFSIAGAGAANAAALGPELPGADAKVLKVVDEYVERHGDFDPDAVDVDVLSQIAREVGVNVEDVHVTVQDVLNDAAVQRTSAGWGHGHGRGGPKVHNERSHNNNIVGDVLNGDILNDVLNGNNINVSDVVNIGGVRGDTNQGQYRGW